MSKSLRMTETTPFSSTMLLLKRPRPNRSLKESSKTNRKHPFTNPRLLHRLRNFLNRATEETQKWLFIYSEIGTLSSPQC